jgi:hypothetical protein
MKKKEAGMGITFDRDEFNIVTIGEQEFFTRAIAGRLHVIPSQCPHRGGPLRLGEVREDRIVCPWHGTAVPIALCRKRALPVVFRKYANSIFVADAGPAAPKRLRWSVGARDTAAGPHAHTGAREQTARAGAHRV